MTCQVIDGARPMVDIDRQARRDAGALIKETIMGNMNHLVDRYIAMWNETDPDRRRGIISEIWTETASYRDPKLEAEGREGIDAMVQKVQAAYPGHRFKLVSDVDVHHDRLRFTWEVGVEGGPILARGLDFAVVTGKQLQSMTGFFDVINAPAKAAVAA